MRFVIMKMCTIAILTSLNPSQAEATEVVLTGPSSVVVDDGFLVVNANISATASVVGQIIFKVGANEVARLPASFGKNSTKIENLLPGNYAITAQFTGGGGNPPATSNVLNVSVQKGSMTIRIDLFPSGTVRPGQDVLIQPTFNPNTPAQPTANFALKVNNKTLQSGSMESIGGRATLPTGDYKFQITYPGDQKYMPSSGFALIRSDAKVGPEIGANASKIGSQIEPYIANGNAFTRDVISWVSPTNSGGLDVLARSILLSGQLGPEFRVNTTITGNQNNPKARYMGDGGWWHVWQSALQDGSGTGIFAQRYLTTGAKAGSEFRVNTTTLSNQDSPDLDFLTVVWRSEVPKSQATSQIKLQRFEDFGKPLGKETRVDTLQAGRASEPSIANLSHLERVGVVWVEKSTPTSPGNIMFRAFGYAKGLPVGAAIRVNSNLTAPKRSPVIRWVGEYFVVAWVSNGQDGSGDGIYAQIFNTVTLAKIGGEFRINGDTIGDQNDLSISMFDVGNAFIATWSSNVNGQGRSVKGRVFLNQAKPTDVEFQVNTNPVADSPTPTVIARTQKEFLVTWRSLSDGSGSGIAFQRFELANVPNAPIIFRFTPK